MFENLAAKHQGKVAVGIGESVAFHVEEVDITGELSVSECHSFAS